jgi:thiamine-monophosphate kinase
MTKRTEINKLGEFGLINHIAKQFPVTNQYTNLGIGDDAAVIDTESNQIVVSSDMFVEGTDFDLSYFPLQHLGYKIVSAGISDILAMNATPTQVLINIGISNRFSVESLDELYSGIKIACKDYQLDMVGGDTTTSRAGLILSVTAIGVVSANQITCRNTARPHDIICLTGDIGAAYMGLQVLEREKQVFLTDPTMQPELSGKDYILQRQLRPEARLDWIKRLHDLDIVPTAMIDLSDGLASDLLHLCSQSKTGASIHEERLPIDDQTFLTADELNISPLTAALNGGEDYELLFTIKQEDYPKLQNETDISFIGYMLPDVNQINIITKAGSIYPIQAQGWATER